MLKDNAIWMGTGEKPVSLLLKQANRHGLIAGASGTGKTVTLKVLAEGFSKAGVPVFMADVKGDITGMCEPGKDSEDMQKRIKKFGIEGFTYEGCPMRLWDMTGGTGAPVRITISDMGAPLLSRLLGLTDVQEGVLDIVFRIADDQKMLLIDMKDLRAMLTYVSEHSKEYETTYGKVSSQSVGAILRAYTPAEQKAVKAAATSFRANPNFDSQEAILELGTEEALVSFLNEDGQPKIVERAKILPPQCLMAAASEDAIKGVMDGQSDLMDKYGTAINRESAFEIISGESEKEEAAQAEAEAKAEEEKKAIEEAKEAEQAAEKAQKEAEKAAEKAAKAQAKQQDQMMKEVGKIASSILGTIGREAARQISRNILGGRRR